MSLSLTSRFSASVALLLVLSGCAHPMRREFARRFDCPVEDVRIAGRMEGATVLRGCGTEARYKCRHNACDIEYDKAPLASTAGNIEAPVSDTVERERSSQGNLRLKTEVRLDHSTVLELSAEPEKHPRSLRARLLSIGKRHLCDLHLMAAGEALESTSTRRGRLQGRHMLEVRISAAALERFASSDYVAARACDERWPLEAAHRQRVRDFTVALREESSLQEDNGTTSGGLAAPAAGWPAWQPTPGSMPESATEPLTSEAIYEKLRPSVYAVTATSSTGGSQGSAVAVGPRTLITNCHVVAGADQVQLHSGGMDLGAKLVSADPPSDRCVLEVTDGEVKPVDGVRAFTDLRVGERAYSLGAPRGLEHTLAEGIVSGKRERDGSALVQTTASISSGSSGGGLFDANGNLIGITTLVLTGGTKSISQALNFAIAADAFWQAQLKEAPQAAVVAKAPASFDGFDMDVQIKTSRSRLRVGGKLSWSRDRVRVQLVKAGSPGWSGCSVQMGDGGAELAAQHQQREGEEAVQFDAPLTELQHWADATTPSLFVCGKRALRLKNRQRGRLREALETFAELSLQ